MVPFLISYHILCPVLALRYSQQCIYVCTLNFEPYMWLLMCESLLPSMGTKGRKWKRTLILTFGIAWQPLLLVPLSCNLCEIRTPLLTEFVLHACCRQLAQARPQWWSSCQVVNSSLLLKFAACEHCIACIFHIWQHNNYTNIVNIRKSNSCTGGHSEEIMYQELLYTCGYLACTFLTLQGNGCELQWLLEFPDRILSYLKKEVTSQDHLCLRTFRMYYIICNPYVY